MNHKLFQIRAFITHWLSAVDAHSLHSPFFYDFYTQVVRPPKNKLSPSSNAQLAQRYRDIERARISMLDNHTLIDMQDLGAGSKHTKGQQRTISTIARHSLSTPGFGQLYQRAIAHSRATYILELGTSLGINTMYLAAQSGTQVVTLEGSPEVAAHADGQFAAHQLNNIEVVRGNIDDTLAPVVARLPRIDFAFMDANHRCAPTLRYFDIIAQKTHAQSIVVLDDIHDSRDMQEAWSTIKNDKRVTGSADLFRCGFVFFDPSLNSQHFVLQI